MKTRIYEVTVDHPKPQNARLVRATSKAQAIRHVALGMINAEPASQDALIVLLRQHVEIEDATGDDGAEAEKVAAQ